MKKKIVIIIVSLVILIGVLCIAFVQFEPYILGEKFFKAPNCESAITKDIAIDIFMEKSPFIGSVNRDYLSGISIINPRTSDYNKEIDKYYCKGTVLVKGDENGFRLANGKAMFYLSNFSVSDYDFYNRYECEVSYTSQLSEQRPYVTTTYCYNGSASDFRIYSE